MPRNVQNIVEEQILRWRAERAEPDTGTAAPLIRPHVVTVAHAVGADGALIAEVVGEMLHIPVYDREIVRHIAENAAVRVETVETLSEKAQGRVEEYLTALVREKNFDRSDYVRHLMRAVAALWEHGPCVMVGNGCVHVVPRTHALAVRIVAPAAVREARLAERMELEPREARWLVQRTDDERSAFHRRSFGADVAACENYDLVLDSTSYEVEAAAAVVAEAFRRKFTTVGTVNHQR